MKYLPFLWSNLMRRRVRTILTSLTLFVAFALFGLLMAVRSAFSYGAELAGADRLMMFHKVSFSQPLPMAYHAQIAAAPGVAAVTHATWFGGIYQDPKNRFVQLAVDGETFLDMHPAYLLPPEQRKAWLADRAGCVVGRELAKRFGWKVGDRVPIRGVGSWRRPDGSQWVFTVDGIYDADTSANQMFFHYGHLNEKRTSGRDHVGWYLVRVADPRQAAQVAEALDAQFANSSYETKTATEKAFLQAWAHQIGDIGAIVMSVVGMVVFTVLLVVANTMAQAIRERTNELAVMKTLGFTDGRVLGLVLAESLVLAAAAGFLGLALAWLVVQRGDPTGGLLPSFYLRPLDLLFGGGLVLAVGAASAALPAWQARRLTIADALGRRG